MNKFEQLYKNIKNKISIIVEDFNVSSDSSFNEDKFDFKKDENNNIICSFAMSLNGKKLIALAKIFNEKITFVITNEEGQSFNYGEKEFATNYYKDYDDFKKAFDKYLKSDSIVDDNEETDGKIKSMNSELEDQDNQDTNVKFEKIFEINGSKFIFKLLNDISVDNYCECIFDFQDKTNEVIYVRSLLNILNKNSVIIKLLFFKEDGTFLEKLTKTEFLKRYPMHYENLEFAIKKMEQFVNEQ
jgi:hypothetical protein